MNIKNNMKIFPRLILLMLTGFISLSMNKEESPTGNAWISQPISKQASPAGTSWISLEKAEEQFSRQKKPILIDLYTNWCGWCRVMDKKTYANKNVAAYLNDKFYPVKVNAESRKELKFMGRTFHFNDRYNTNELALFLTNNQLSYPTTIIIPVNGAPQIIPGYMEPADFEVILKYFGEGKFGRESFDKYRAAFRTSWK